MSATRSPITTHVLDLRTGKPGRGIRIFLRVKEKERDGDGNAGAWREIGRGVTDADGRVKSLLPDGATISAGTYQLCFDTLSYFKENPSSPSSSFFPEITITFTVTDPAAHTHVPLLLSPFGYSTYRGS